MLQSSNLLQSPHHHLLLKIHFTKPTPQSPPIPTRISCKLSRRELTIFTNSSLLLLSTSQTLLPATSKAEQQEQEQEKSIQPQDINTYNKAEENPQDVTQPAEQNLIQSEENAPPPQPQPQPQEPASSCIENSKPPTKRAFIDISIDRQPVGRIIIGIYENSAPFGASRFIDLVSGRAGISYRKKEFVKIMPNYVQHGGIRSYGVDAELAQRSAGKDLNNNDALKQEWEKGRKSECPGGRRSKNLEGSVGIVVRDPSKPPPKTKLVARGGKLEIDEEEVGLEPNGTQFLICNKDCPELDDSVLVIGRVVEGMDVVNRIGRVQTVQDNTTSPYFRVAKLIGDKRAVVAERGFNRPYSKVLVTNCGLLE